MDASTWETVAKTVGAVAPLLLGILGLVVAPGRARRALKDDSEILKNLPKDSAAQEALLQHMERQIAELQARSTRKRDWPMFGFVVVAAPLLGWLTVSLAFRDEWWWKVASVVSGVLTLLFVYGAFETTQRVDRDEKGRRKRQTPPAATT